MKRTAISYLDYAINPVIGCTPTSEGCLHCYAQAWAKRCGRDFSQVTVNTKLMLSMAKMKFGTDNLRRGTGSKPLVGVCFLSDLFHPDVPIGFIYQMFDVMSLRQDVDWIVLTKRPQRLAELHEYIEGYNKFWCENNSLDASNIWLGVTAENQARADERIPILLEHWAGPKFVSIEPALEYVDISDWSYDCGYVSYSPLDWVIVGAESGNNRRPFDTDWARQIYRDCRWFANPIPFFGKQDSGAFPGVPLLIGGKIIHEWPVSR